MKKIFKLIIAFVVASLGILTYTNVLAASGTERYTEGTNAWGSGLSNKVGGVNTIGTTNAQDGGSSTIIDTIKNAINRILGMLSLIALVLCLWGGFQMLTAAGDDSKVKTGTKILKNAAIGLAIIGLAWLLVSFVFRIVGKTTGEAGV